MVYLFELLIFLAALFLILLVLVQRGKGGGLAGAFGGSGGSSSFGVKASDAFVKVTMWTAFIWILLCVATIKFMNVQNPIAVTSPNTENVQPGMSATTEEKEDKGKATTTPKTNTKSNTKTESTPKPDSAPSGDSSSDGE